MPFDWDDYFNFAGAIVAKQQPSQAECRSAVSRAYYSVFCVAKQKKGVPNKDSWGNGGVHNRVIQAYEDGNATDLIIAGKLLDLMDMRVAADYNATVVIDKCKAQSAYNLAKEIRSELVYV